MLDTGSTTLYYPFERKYKKHNNCWTAHHFSHQTKIGGKISDVTRSTWQMAVSESRGGAWGGGGVVPLPAYFAEKKKRQKGSNIFTLYHFHSRPTPPIIHSVFPSTIRWSLDLPLSGVIEGGVGRWVSWFSDHYHW